MQLTPGEIGARIKQHYQGYSEVDDMKLGDAYMRKYGAVIDPSRQEAQKQGISTPPIVSQGLKAVGGAVGSILGLIQKYFPKEQWQNALNVAKGESGLNPGAIGDNYPIRGQTIPSYGLFQIRALPGRPKPEQLVDPEFNVQYAANLFKAQGWRPWSFARKLGLVK